jgi:hypothetical protein
MSVPLPKNPGRTVMSSDFLGKDGVLTYSDEVWAQIKDEPEIQAEIASRGEFQAKRAGAILDITTDRWYTTERCRADFKKAHDIVQKNSGGRLNCLIITDWSPIHRNKGEDALNVLRMNVGIGGKQPLMREGHYTKDGEKVGKLYSLQYSHQCL